MFGQRKARKSSPDPEGRYNDSSSSIDALSGTPQNRRRAKPRDLGGLSMPSQPSGGRRTNSSLPLYNTPPPGSSTCNSFLLGGHYYPGKDKKAKHFQKRTIWYRIFCSSSWRKVLSTVAVAYILMWQVLVPGLNVVLDYGAALAGGQVWSKNPADALSGLNLPPIEQQREESNMLKLMKDKLKGNSRLKYLEKIAPDWYHRNDNPNSPDTANGDKPRIKDDSEPAIDGNDPPQVQNDDEYQHAQARHRQEPKHDKPGVVKNTALKQPMRPKSKTANDADPSDTRMEDRHQKDPIPEKGKVVTSEQDETRKTDPEIIAATSQLDEIKTDAGKGGQKAISEEKMPLDDAPKVQPDKSVEDAEASLDDKSHRELPPGLKEDGSVTTIDTKQASMEDKEQIHANKKGEGEEVPLDDKSHRELPPGLNEDGSVTHIERTLHTMDEFPNQSLCPSTVNSINTTLLIQCSVDRMWILKETCRRWTDPIVAVIHLTENQKSNADAWKMRCPQMRVVPYVADKDEKAWHYPVNRLRNLGLDVVQTSHVIVADVDFVPSQGLDQVIRHTLKERQKQRGVAESTVALEERDAIVVPAFERVEDCSKTDCGHILKTNSSYLPKTKDDLKRCMSDKNCIVFQANNNWEGHYSTQSRRWIDGDDYENEELELADGTKSKVLKRVPCFDSLRYEPYVVIRWCPSASPISDQVKPVAPYYDERFYGYGKNKIQMISHLRFLGYQFSILSHGFIVHNPHNESNAKKVWNDVQDYKLHETMDALYPKFLNELLEKYKTVTDPRTIVVQCKRRTKL
jgi:hypothetical protein